MPPVRVAANEALERTRLNEHDRTARSGAESP